MPILRLPPQPGKIMKAINDPRHARRRRIVQQLFAVSYTTDQKLDPETQTVWDQHELVDPFISKTAPEWPLDKLNKTDLAILRLAVWELKFDKKEPVKVVIDEAIELAKELGSENSPSFINGVLGTIAKEEHLGVENPS